jgi:hypothetical protein
VDVVLSIGVILLFFGLPAVALVKGFSWSRKIIASDRRPRARLAEVLFLLIALVPGVWLTVSVTAVEQGPAMLLLCIAVTVTLGASAILGWLYANARTREPDGIDTLTRMFLGVMIAAPWCFVLMITVPSLLASRIAVNEFRAVAALKACAAAQAEFQKLDRYAKGVQVYANPVDGAGFPDLCELGGAGSEGKTLRLINRKVAQATNLEHDHRGYWFADITGDGNGPFDYAKQFGLCAVPVQYNRSGRNVFIVNHQGRVYQKDLASIPGREISTGDVSEPVTTWPDVEKEGWLPVED